MPFLSFWGGLTDLKPLLQGFIQSEKLAGIYVGNFLIALQRDKIEGIARNGYLFKTFVADTALLAPCIVLTHGRFRHSPSSARGKGVIINGFTQVDL
jgi:hypothetical protein